jgi:DNA-binding CsgD family transcriptional regulator
MESLTFEDTRKLLHSIHSIYGLRDLEAFGRDSLEILSQLVPTEAAFINNSDASLTNNQLQFSTPDFERLFTQDVMSKCQQYISESPLVKNMSLCLKEVHAISDFVTLSDFQRTEGYQQAATLVGIDNQIGILLYSNSPTVPYSEGQFAYYVLYQDWNHFTERDRLLLNLFQPHLSHAFQTALHCQHQQQAIAQLQQSLDQSGIVFLDQTGTVQWITAQAERWLQQYIPSPRTNRQLPDQIQSWVDNQINHLNTEYDVPEVCLPLRLEQGDGQLVIRLVKDQNQEKYLLLLAEEPILSLLKALERLGLSAREAQILAAIIQGRSPKEIAHTLQISTSTVRKHLENIYRKLHVQSQTEAVALALQKLGKNFRLS